MSSAHDSARGCVSVRKHLRTSVAVILASVAIGGGLMASPVKADPAQPEGRAGVDSGPTTHGFLFEKGTFITIDYPGAVGTAAVSINADGVVVGSFDDGSTLHGYVRDARGTFTRLDYPDAALTALHRINDSGQIVGAYRETLESPRRGFVYHQGTFTPIDVKAAMEVDVNGINAAGQVAGWYAEADGRVHGMVWEDGAITTVDVPGAFVTELIDINDAGELVGDSFGLPLVVAHGLFVSDGVQTSFDAPGLALTFPYGLNNSAQIALVADNDPGLTTVRGFLLERGVGGAFTRFKVPGAELTQPYDIDDDGRVVGLHVSGGTATSARRAMADRDDVTGRAPFPPGRAR